MSVADCASCADVVALDLVVPAIAGLVQGCVYGLLGLGIVLLYKSGRIFNFAQAEMGAFSAFVTAFCDQGSGPLPNMPVWLAVLFGLLTGVGLGLAIERIVIRPLFSAPKVTIVVATAGVFLFLFAIEGFCPAPVRARPPGSWTATSSRPGRCASPTAVA